jgi:hypothetical protein
MQAEKILVVLNCYFNYRDIERTVGSILDNNIPVDIVFLENPSKYSFQIREIAIKYKIFKHYMCSGNIELNTFTLFANTHPEIINQYNYVAVSEADVVLSKDSMVECLAILAKYDKCHTCSIDLELNYSKYNKLPIRSWVPIPIVFDDYLEGPTGWQFIIFKRPFLLDFVKALNKRELVSKVSLGTPQFYGLSDSNLRIFVGRTQTRWLRTKLNKLDHIGWEHYLDNKDEYCVEKNKNLSNKKIRINIDVNNYQLVELVD